MEENAPNCNYQSMEQCCLLSDKIDKISTLHLKLCKLAENFCDAFAAQFVVCHSFTAMLFIFKMYVDFLIIRSSIVSEEYFRLPIMIWILCVNIASSIVDLLSIAGVCSKIKSKVSVRVELP